MICREPEVDDVISTAIFEKQENVFVAFDVSRYPPQIIPLHHIAPKAPSMFFREPGS